MGDEPGEALLGGRERQHAETQRRPGQGTAQGEHVAAAGTELLDDVGDDAGVGCRRRREHRRALGQRRQQVADAAVVGTEVVAPVADAVGLVDDEQAARLGERGQLLVAEARVVEALGADEQHVDLAACERAGHGAPLLGVRRVERDGLDARALGSRDLVAHQGQQGADDDGGTGALGPPEGGGHEVDGRLAPSGALHDEHAPPPGHELVDRLELAVAEVDVLSADEPPERGRRSLAEGGLDVGDGRCGGGRGGG